MSNSSYDLLPRVNVPRSEGKAVSGWNAIAQRILSSLTLNKSRQVVVVDCYPGVDLNDLSTGLCKHLKPIAAFRSDEAFLNCEAIDDLVKPFLGGDDRIFGYMTNLRLDQFFDPARLKELRQRIQEAPDGLILVIGIGASLVATGELLIYADMPRWEIQMRFRRNEVSNLGVENRNLDWGLQYKRAFFVDWRVADRHKLPLIPKIDFFIDTTKTNKPKLAEGDAVREGLQICTQRPFRVVPFFDPAPWGGQWMKSKLGLDQKPENYGWCFDCVPEENSLLLGIGDEVIEIPSLDLVLTHPLELLGEAVYGRFGREFPIRFDFLDTMDGGSLSLQVHPDTRYIQDTFGMHYTQDESYYLLDAKEGATVYLGLREDADIDAFVSDLTLAQETGEAFEAERHVNRWPAKKHDHFLIPAGTVHCSGSNSMVLEISATPYIFTFKLWDWGRLGLDGRPRPINIGHGKQVIRKNQRTEICKQELVNHIEVLNEGDRWREERTGLHRMEFIEVRRHWFSVPVEHDTQGGVLVMNLVEGEAAIVESPTGAFEPFEVHYAETWIVPAAVGRFTVRPLSQKPMATVKAFVRNGAQI